MNRKLHTTLFCYSDIKENADIQTKLEIMKWKQKQRYDKSTNNLRPLVKDDVVCIQDQDAWNRKATVLQEVGPTSYEVRPKEGHGSEGTVATFSKPKRLSQKHNVKMQMELPQCHM